MVLSMDLILSEKLAGISVLVHLFASELFIHLLLEEVKIRT